MNWWETVRRRSLCGTRILHVDVHSGRQQAVTFRCCQPACLHCCRIMWLQGDYVRLALALAGRDSKRI